MSLIFEVKLIASISLLTIAPFFHRWELLGCNDLLDFCAASGLKKLEEFFQGKYEEVEERESNIQGRFWYSMTLVCGQSLRSWVWNQI